MEGSDIAQRGTAAASTQWRDAGYCWAACGSREELLRARGGSGAAILSHGGMRQLLASICSICQRLAFALYVSDAHAWHMQSAVLRVIRTVLCCDLRECVSLLNAVVARIVRFARRQPSSDRKFVPRASHICCIESQVMF